MEEKARTFHCNKIIKWSYRLQVVEWHESIDLNEGWMEYSMMVKTPICDYASHSILVSKYFLIQSHRDWPSFLREAEVVPTLTYL